MEYIKRLWQSALEFWHGKSRTQKIMYISFVVGFVLVLSLAIYFLTKPNFVPLYSDLDLREAGEVAKKLDAMSVKYELADGGKTILVSPEDKYKVRIQLAQEGLPKGGLNFSDVMDNTKLGTTEWEKQLQYNQALQGELTRTIESLEEVESASVHIVQQERTNFLNLDNASKPTAAVVLKLIPGAEIRDEQVLGIINLVSHSVRGLDPENVTIIDNYGRVLSDLASNPEEASQEIVNAQLAIQNQLQRQLQANVQSLLEQIYGVGNVAVRVNAKLNFDKKSVESRIFTPVNEETGEGILLSTQELREYSSGTGATAPQGPPGVDANVEPTYQELIGGETEYSRTEVIRNYEINETLESLDIAPGAVENISVSVVINKELNDDEKTSIANMVARAAGSDPERDIAVEGIEFSNDFVRALENLSEYEQRQRTMRSYTLIGLGLIIALVLLIVLRRLSRRDRDQENELTIAEQIASAQEEAAAARSIEDEMEEDRTFSEIQRYARRRPEDIAKVLRTWLDEE